MYRCTVDMVNKISVLYPKHLNQPCLYSPSSKKSSLTSRMRFFISTVRKIRENSLEFLLRIRFYRFKRLIQGFINSSGIMQSCIMMKVDFPALKKILELKWDAVVLWYIDDTGGGVNNGCPFHLL